MSALESWKKTDDVAVTTYETTGHFNLDSNFRFSMLIVDEAHYIKNPEAQRTINVSEISNHAERLLFMTGIIKEEIDRINAKHGKKEVYEQNINN